MDDTNPLSLEQEFSIKSFESTVSRMDLEQAQQCLVQLYRDSILREENYKHLLKHHWGFGEPPCS
ncbi:MAG: NblA-related protein [Coleofasciculaceae cyanobacterium RL_1_1]|nr:NblA-related protein [Coleofasciculaceae cyanobacterium RL_1_1]